MSEDEWVDENDFQTRSVDVAELQKLAQQGAFKRKRKSKYREFLESFKNSADVAREAKGITASHVSQLVPTMSKVFTDREVRSKTLNVTGKGSEARYDVIFIKKTPETEEVLAPGRIYSASRRQVTTARSQH